MCHSLPTWARVRNNNNDDNTRQHLEAPRVHLEAPSCLVSSARQPATLHKQLGINAMDRSLLLCSPFSFFATTQSSGNVLHVIGRHFFTGFKQVRPSTTFRKAHDSAAAAAHHHVVECPTPSGRAMCCSSVALRQKPRMRGEQDNRRPRMIAPVACEPSTSTCRC